MLVNTGAALQSAAKQGGAPSQDGVGDSIQVCGSTAGPNDIPPTGAQTQLNATYYSSMII